MRLYSNYIKANALLHKVKVFGIVEVVYEPRKCSVLWCPNSESDALKLNEWTELFIPNYI